MKRFPLRYPGLSLLAGLALLGLPASQAAPSNVRELRIQKVGDITYFHARLDTPGDLLQDATRPNLGFFAEPSPSLAPRLIGPAGQLRLVCQRVTVDGLEFLGRASAQGEVKAKLVYPVRGRGREVSWQETKVVLDFSKAKQLAVPASAATRRENARRQRDSVPLPGSDDLEGLWAAAQVNQLVELDNEVHEFGFYGFAASTVARKYGVATPVEPSWRMWNRLGGRRPSQPSEFVDRELFETTTGAAAITESLQLRRMNATGGVPSTERTIAIDKVRGIDIAEHPWKEMIGDRKPAAESFPRLVPHDNYYIHFKRIARFLEFSELLDQWGTNLTRAYELTSRDHRLKERYQQQLCLRSTALGKTLGPLVIQGVALTGNDAYLREGSDLAVLFEVTQQKLFLAAVEPFIAEARKKFGEALSESKLDYHGVQIESFVTPLREVSLHRASIGNFVIYANSPAGIRRIIDTHQGKIRRLSDSLDFQYMRTVFRHDDKDEDGFAFLSDAFIRNLVGPASKIKERRRLEALVSLHMLTSGAMYTAWETGKPPVSGPSIFDITGLGREEVPVPEGKPAFWDTERLLARSEVYNTIHFATPLIELPIDKVTPAEADEYNRFRLEYLGLWRQFFDPIGMRVSLKDGQVRLDTYILPLIQNSSYNRLRRITGQKSVRFSPASLSDRTLMQYLIRLNDNVADRESLFGLRGRDAFHPLTLLGWALDPVGDWFLVRLDDSPVYEKLLALAKRSEQGENVEAEEVARQVWSLPLALAADIRNPVVFAGALATARNSVMSALPGALSWGPLKKEYKGVSIVRIQATPGGREMLGPVLGRRDGGADGNPFLPTVYYAMIDRGFYLTLNEPMMRRLIDGAAAGRDGKGTVEVAASLYLAPKAAEHARGALRHVLERQTFQQARTSLPIWYALYRTGIVAEDAGPEQAREAAYRYLGFVPVSPDGTAYRYDRAYDEVANERHGSFRKPTPRAATAEASPLNFLLDQLRSVRADLRFREDGIHTVLTIERVKSAKE